MDIPTLHPPRLKKGDTVAIVAPAGPIEQREGLQRGIATLEKMGFRAKYSERIFQSSRYLAGDDATRAEELMLALEDDSIKAVVGLRGGYGCARLIPRLMSRQLRGQPKIFLGFSDLTTLHLFFNRHFGWITLHGPVATTLDRCDPATEQGSHLRSLMTDPEYRPVLNFAQLETWEPGRAEGTLTGGCLSLITASIGTPYEIETEGKILFLEDLGEPPYRLDRMITHLQLAGKFRSLAGILLGTFHECEPTQGDYTTADVLKEMLQPLHIPILANFPAGHGPDNWAIPFGARVCIDADARSVEFMEPAVL
jgi:muramoyltetrapeptide carboxypeptidase